MPGRLRYKIATLSFFDILGFRRIVETRPPQEIARILRHFRRRSQPDPESARLYDQKFFHFSDSVVRTVNIASDANLKIRSGILFHELMDLLHIQIELLAERVLLRGAVTLGKVYEGKPYVFGPALNRAYLIESKEARYPRIVVDEMIRKGLRSLPHLWAGHHDYEDERRYLKDLTRRSSDGLHFLDYAATVASEVDEPESYLEFLFFHRDLICQGAAAAQDDPKTRIKYRWLAAYHNRAVRELRASFLRRHNIECETLVVPYKAIRPLDSA